MLFSTPVFLFVFAPIVFIVDALLPRRVRNLWLLAASLVFYAWGEARFLPIAFASCIADHMLARGIAASTDDRRRRLLLTAGIVLNVGLLVYFKYLAFLVENARVLWPGLPHLHIVLPLAISFIVFEKITYLVDVYRGISTPARHLRDYFLFIFLFPKILAGPILKFHEVIAPLESRVLSFNDFGEGLTRFIVGLAKKVLIADPAGTVTDQIFGAPVADLGFGTAWLGAISFTVQIYFDFSAYSDMAIGLARMLGLRLPENFRQPYLATGFADFWRRWHISLSSWIREYLYIPLGGNRGSWQRTYFNLWLCFLASGIWHGANWTFVVWGIYHGIFVCADHAGMKAVWPRIPRPIGVAVTFLLVVIGWVLFRSPDFTHAAGMLGAMAQPFRASAFTPDVNVLSGLALATGLLMSFTPFERVRALAEGHAMRFVQPAAALGVLTLALFAFARSFTASFTPFIYFQF